MEAVVFDLDGVLVDSERMWDEVRRSIVAEHGGTWTDEATTAHQGMSTSEWSRYLVDERGAQLSPEEIATAAIDEMASRYAEHPPVLPGAERAVRAATEFGPVAIASSSPPVLIDCFLQATGLADVVRVAVSSKQVGAGKPAPDVYLHAAKRLGVSATGCVAVEDSTNGLKAALEAGMTVVAVPNPHLPPDPDILASVGTVLERISELPAALALLAATT